MMEMLKTARGTDIYRLTPARCNIFVVSRYDRHIVVDTGISFDRSRIESALSRKGIVPEAVVLTHTHFDHAGNAAWLAREYGAEIVVQAAEAGFLAAGDTPIPSGTIPVTKGLSEIGKKVSTVFKYEPCVADHVFENIFDLNRFGIDGYIMHTPGHCAGQSAVVIDEEIALTGDSLIGIYPGKIFPPFADDSEELLRSWLKLLDTGCRTFLPGHGSHITREELAAEYMKRTKENDESRHVTFTQS
jgi:glyoxylase-like metal-dependent hydrolase (beta-lactamase superfamily II)